MALRRGQSEAVYHKASGKRKGKNIMPRCNDGDILCPFYIARTRMSITCEGLTDDSIIKLLFITHETKRMHRKTFCAGRYKACEIYKMLERKYEG